MAFLRLIRYKNLLMVLLTMVLTKYFLIDSYVPSTISDIEFLILTSSIVLIAAGGYVINDIYDLETDKINNPKKVIISIFITKKKSWMLYFTLSIIGVMAGIYVSFEKQVILYSLYFISSVVLLFFYSLFFKRTPLFGNIIVSFLISLSIFLVYEFQHEVALISNIFTNLSLGMVIFSYILFSFLSTLIREIIKDIEDVDGDYAINAKTLPIVIGRKRTNRVAVGFTALLILFLVIIIKDILIGQPIFLAYVSIFLLLPLLYFSYKLWIAKTKKEYHFLSTFMKAIMLFGILSMLLFKL